MVATQSGSLILSLEFTKLNVQGYLLQTTNNGVVQTCLHMLGSPRKCANIGAYIFTSVAVIYVFIMCI